jgi:biotin transporter BioY
MFDKLFQMKLKRIEKRGERQKARQELVDKYAQYYPSKRRKVSNVMLAIIVVAVIAYTVASFWLAYVSGVSIDPTLTTCFYAFWSAEVCAMMGIKISKVRKEHTDEDSLG